MSIVVNTEISLETYCAASF